MSVDVMGEMDIITSEQIADQQKQEAEDRLVPAGTFEGLVVSWNKQDEGDKTDNSPWRGIPVYRVGVMFYDCPEAGKKKSQFFNMTPQKVLGDSGKPKLAYTSLVNLVKVMGKEGQPVSEALEQAKVQRAKYRVGMFTTPEGNTVNFLKAVSMACLMLVALVGCNTTLTRTCAPGDQPGYQNCLTAVYEQDVACIGACGVK